MRLIAVILAGGRGERFWPLSRRLRPKQFLPLLDERSMLAHTVERIRGPVRPEDVWILTAKDLATEAAELAPEVPREHVIGEPAGKNTAPAIGLASWWLREEKNAVLLVLPSDHRIHPSDRFREELTRAAKEALDRRAIVTFGIPPTRPETGYGYIESGKEIGPGLHEVRAFREKPDARTAAEYARDRRHLWNAGMFVFAPGVMLEEIRAFRPDLMDLLERMPRRDDPETEQAVERFYREAPSVSIDYAVMERSRRVLVQRAGFEWDDVGSWAALGLAGHADSSGNVARGEAILHDCRGVIAFAEQGLVAGVGVQDLVIVHTRDVTLVCSRARAQEVRAIVERLKQRSDLDEYL